MLLKQKNIQVQMPLFILQHVSISDVDSPQEDQKVEKTKEGKGEQNVWETFFCCFNFSFNFV